MQAMRGFHQGWRLASPLRLSSPTVMISSPIRAPAASRILIGLAVDAPSSTALLCVTRFFHQSSLRLQDTQNPPPTPPATRSSPPLPSLKPVLTEVQARVTRPLLLSEVYRSLSPEARRILVAHKLPLEELLLHLPRHFALYSIISKKQRMHGAVTVAPPYTVPATAIMKRAPPGARPPLALAELLGHTPQVTTTATTTNPDTAVGSGFVGRESTQLQRIQEVLMHIPNEWVLFTELPISREVKMRCMNYPNDRPASFFMKYPQYFEIRLQSRAGHSFEVRRSMALQQQLREVAHRPN